MFRGSYNRNYQTLRNRLLANGNSISALGASLLRIRPQRENVYEVGLQQSIAGNRSRWACWRAGLLFVAKAANLLRLFLTTGILGGFTTFSAFSLDAALLWERGQTAGAALYVMGSVATAIIGVFTGLAVMRALLS